MARDIGIGVSGRLMVELPQGRGPRDGVISWEMRQEGSLSDVFDCNTLNFVSDQRPEIQLATSYSSAFSGSFNLNTYISNACLCCPMLLNTMARAS